MNGDAVAPTYVVQCHIEGGQPREICATTSLPSLAIYRALLENRALPRLRYNDIVAARGGISESLAPCLVTFRLYAERRDGIPMSGWSTQRQLWIEPLFLAGDEPTLSAGCLDTSCRRDGSDRVAWFPDWPQPRGLHPESRRAANASWRRAQRYRTYLLDQPKREKARARAVAEREYVSYRALSARRNRSGLPDTFSEPDQLFEVLSRAKLALGAARRAASAVVIHETSIDAYVKARMGERNAEQAYDHAVQLFRAVV